MTYRNPVRAVGVVGTVTTTSSGSGGTTPTATPAFRDSSSSSTPTQGSVTLPTPAGTQVGDLLVLIVGTPVTTAPTGPPAGWTTLTVTGGQYLAVYTKTATATEARGAASVTVNGTGSGGNTTAVMLAVANATTVSPGTAAVSSGTNTVPTGSVASPTFLAFVRTGLGSGSSIGSWKWYASNQPPSPVPTLVSDGTVIGNPGSTAVVHATANWTTAASYDALWTSVSGDGGCYVCLRIT